MVNVKGAQDVRDRDKDRGEWGLGRGCGRWKGGEGGQGAGEGREGDRETSCAPDLIVCNSHIDAEALR